MKTVTAQDIQRPDRIGSYFRAETGPLAIVTVSGLIYNAGLTAGPYFEGRLAQCLFDVMKGQNTVYDMLRLAGAYLGVIILVQLMRCLKRFYVRRFANDTSKTMRGILYNGLVHTPRSELQGEGVGPAMTRAVADVDACAEGMRKFTTEVFDTGVALIAYLAMLFYYDWRLALIASAFTPAAYFIAERLKKTVYRSAAAYKKSAGALNDATMDRLSNALTYRVYGREENRDKAYEKKLDDYEKRAVAANVWENTMQPIYNVISMAGVVFIVWLGGQNVAGTGWAAWNIAAFTTFLSCFTRMAMKSSKAAKLFNAVQKARVSWQRIKPLMKPAAEENTASDMDFSAPGSIEVTDLSFAYPGGKTVLKDLSFAVKPGQIIGVTGPVAAGKSTLGRVFLGETPYEGSVKVCGRELKDMTAFERAKTIAYTGHAPELFTADAAENVRLGGEKPAGSALKAVCLSDELPQGENTSVGSEGAEISGGQAARLALARALYADGRVLILDDPFASVDKATEGTIAQNIKSLAADRAVLLISHRLYLFPELDGVIWLENGGAELSDHKKLIAKNGGYARFYRAQTEGGRELDEK